MIAHRLLEQRGIDLSHDIELISCDNDPVLSGLNPLPATIDINPELIGREAVALLLREINSGNGHSLRQRILVEPRLIRPEEHPSFVPELKVRPGLSHAHP